VAGPPIAPDRRWQAGGAALAGVAAIGLLGVAWYRPGLTERWQEGVDPQCAGLITLSSPLAARHCFTGPGHRAEPSGAAWVELGIARDGRFIGWERRSGPTAAIVHRPGDPGWTCATEAEFSTDADSGDVVLRGLGQIVTAPEEGSIDVATAMGQAVPAFAGQFDSAGCSQGYRHCDFGFSGLGTTTMVYVRTAEPLRGVDPTPRAAANLVIVTEAADGVTIVEGGPGSTAAYTDEGALALHVDAPARARCADAVPLAGELRIGWIDGGF
jgi:hypothetical protein